MARKRRSSDIFWETDVLNSKEYVDYLTWIFSLALNRFRWEGLPETVSERYLEETILRTGMASIARDESGTWYSFQVVHGGELTVYGEPAKWEALSADGAVRYPANWETGAIVYDSRSRVTPWAQMVTSARLLAKYTRAEQINLSHQAMPMMFTAPKTRRQELVNLIKQAFGGEPAVIGSDRMMEDFKYETIGTPVPFIGQELAIAKENAWREIYRYLGIEHLAFEKGERMIEEEAEATAAPTILRRLDALEARRDAARHLSGLMSREVRVVFNDDVASYNWAFENDRAFREEVLA